MGERMQCICMDRSFQDLSSSPLLWQQKLSKNVWVNREQAGGLPARHIMNYWSVMQKANKVIAIHTHHSKLMSSVNLAT